MDARATGPCLAKADMLVTYDSWLQRITIDEGHLRTPLLPAIEPAARSGTKVLVFRWGSIERSPHIVTLVNFLVDRGFRVKLATVEAGRRPASLALGTEYVTFNHGEAGGAAKVLKLGLLARRFRRLVRETVPDVLYTIDSWTLPLVLLTTAARPRAVASVFVYHTFDWLDPAHQNRIHRWYERHVCRQADLCVNVDRSRARLVQSFYRLSATPFWLPNYPLRDEKAPERDEALRARLLDDGGRFLIVCPSVAAPGRLHLQLLRALSLLSTEYRLVTFAGDGEYFRECQRLVGSLHLRDRVKFLAPCPYEELAHLLSCADMGVILNDWKTSSGYWMANSGRLANLLTASVPIVASDVPNLEALMYRWGLGECCDAYDPCSIAEAIRRIADKPPGIEGRRRAVWRAFQEELYFERRGVLLVGELKRLCTERGGGLDDGPAMEGSRACSQ